MEEPCSSEMSNQSPETLIQSCQSCRHSHLLGLVGRKCIVPAVSEAAGVPNMQQQMQHMVCMMSMGMQAFQNKGIENIA